MQPILIVALALACATASAAKPKSKHRAAPKPAPAPAAKVDPFAPAPLDVVLARTMKGNRSKKTKSLKSAWSALQAKQFGKARARAGALLRDASYGDYAAWIAGLADQGSAHAALAAKRYGDAEKSAQASIALWSQVEASHPSSPVSRQLVRDMGESEILIGDAQARTRRPKSALGWYERGFTRLNAISAGSLGLVAPASLQAFGEACSSSPDETCVAWVTRISSIHPRASEEYKALTRGCAPQGDRLRPAPVSRATQSYRSPDLDQIAIDEALQHVQRGDNGDAIKALSAFLDTYPRSAHRFRARYWLAQSLARDKQQDKARKQFTDLMGDSPLSWYGMLAALATATDFGSMIPANAMPKAAERDPFLNAGEIRRLKRAKELLAEGAQELAAVELADMRPRDALGTPFLVYVSALCNEARAYSTAFVLITELIQRGSTDAVSPIGEKMIFPTPYQALVQKYANEYQLDPTLLWSLIKQESAFNVAAVSSTGAMGLMQLMPSTAVGTSPGVTRIDLHEADANIKVGAKYLKQLLNRFHGNIALALAAYNAGPGAVNRWLKENPKRPMLEFIEGIPYKETREYVGSIIRNYYWYSRRLGHDAPKDLAFFWGAVQPAAKADDVDPAENPED